MLAIFLFQKEMKLYGHTKEEMELEGKRRADMTETQEQGEAQVLPAEVILQIKMAVGETMERRDGQAMTHLVRLVVTQ